MKNAILTVSVIAAVALGVLCVTQRRQLGEHKSQINSLQQTVDEKSQQLQELQTAEQRSASEREELRRKADAYAAKVVQAQQTSSAPVVAAAVKPLTATPGADGGSSSNDLSGFGKALSKMMSDPEMKKFMQNQQRMMADQLYNPLIKQLGLTPDEAGKFKDLIVSNQMNGTAQATALMGGDSTNRADAMASITQAQKDSDEAMKEFLGDARYAQYKDYQTTVGERTVLNMFQQQNAGTPSALSDQQTDQLLALMKEERQNVATATGQPLPGSGDDQISNLQAMTSPEQMQKFLESQETVNDRVYDRAREVLSPDQLQSFGQFQTNQLQMMRMGMTMASKMFGSQKSGADTPPPSQ
jgi:hypothetical protein